ncbi:MAG: methionine--tRNA ligase [Candidatus Sericytochromatia bacterium]|nr:methionine--tRNA ligase [Candidatus Sericytochromatia bacterium]
MTANRFYVTTPIYYVNDEAHIGHAYTTTLADVLNRYHRLFGADTFFLTGTDEHGQKVQQAAEKRGISPQAHCDEMAPRFARLWQTMHIQPDDFVRTTEARHTAIVRDVLQKIWDKDLIYADVYKGFYEISEERFLTDKEMQAKGYTAESPEVVQIEEKNYFFKMSQFQDWLIGHIESYPEFIQPEGRRKEILGFLKQPLGDLCISRPKSRLSWGVELPFDTDYVTYVWFDALLNYVSVHLDRGGEAELQKWWPHAVHLVGKDILTTHAVYWPTMLKAAGYEPFQSLIAHGWWLMDNAKMSKSKGNVVKPLDLMQKYGVDAFRYFLIRDMSLGQDSQFSEQALVERMNSDLANDFGNLLNRTLKLLDKYFQGVIPSPGPAGELEQELVTLAEQTLTDVRQLVGEYKLHTALETILQLVRRANKYLEQTAPWKLAKADLAAAGSVLWHVLEVFRLAATLLSPVIPGKMQALLTQLGLSEDTLQLRWGVLPAGIQTGAAEALFPRQELIKQEDETMSETLNETTNASPEAKIEPTAQAAATTAPAAPPAEDPPENVLIDIQDFAKVQLRVAEVTFAERVPKTDKLLRLEVSLGDETRQIVAGIAAYYEPEALVGKQIVIVANLKPAKLRGIMSHGMLLAAKSGDQLSVLGPINSVATGASIS